jgi:hypothetical protein
LPYTFEKFLPEHFKNTMKTVSATPAATPAVAPLFKDRSLQHVFEENAM